VGKEASIKCISSVYHHGNDFARSKHQKHIKQCFIEGHSSTAFTSFRQDAVGSSEIMQLNAVKPNNGINPVQKCITWTMVFIFQLSVELQF
jgi:hypothetical protein